MLFVAGDLLGLPWYRLGSLLGFRDHVDSACYEQAAIYTVKYMGFYSSDAIYTAKYMGFYSSDAIYTLFAVLPRTWDSLG